MDTKRKEISRKEIINQIAEVSGYHKYEVEDMYESMLHVYRKLLLEQRVINFGGMFMIDYRDSKVRDFHSPNFGKKITSLGGARLALRNLRNFNTRIRDVSLGKTTVDEELALFYNQPSEDTGESETT